VKILIMGLPGSGKTHFARQLLAALPAGAIHYNADEVRATINRHLGFSAYDREHQAYTMGWLCEKVHSTGGIAVADFVCPTPKTRALFGHDCTTVFINTIDAGRFHDTNRMFQRPISPDYTLTDWADSDDLMTRIITP